MGRRSSSHWAKKERCSGKASVGTSSLAGAPPSPPPPSPPPPSPPRGNGGPRKANAQKSPQPGPPSSSSPSAVPSTAAAAAAAARAASSSRGARRSEGDGSFALIECITSAQVTGGRAFMPRGVVAGVVAGVKRADRRPASAPLPSASAWPSSERSSLSASEAPPLRLLTVASASERHVAHVLSTRPPPADAAATAVAASAASGGPTRSAGDRRALSSDSRGIEGLLLRHSLCSAGTASPATATLGAATLGFGKRRLLPRPVSSSTSRLLRRRGFCLGVVSGSSPAGDEPRGVGEPRMVGIGPNARPKLQKLAAREVQDYKMTHRGARRRTPGR